MRRPGSHRQRPEDLQGIRQSFRKSRSTILDLEQDLAIFRELEDKYTEPWQLHQSLSAQPEGSFSPETTAVYVELFGTQYGGSNRLQSAWTWPALKIVLPVLPASREARLENAFNAARDGRGMLSSSGLSHVLL
jgi:hypothetical protein